MSNYQEALAELAVPGDCGPSLRVPAGQGERQLVLVLPPTWEIPSLAPHPQSACLLPLLPLLSCVT